MLENVWCRDAAGPRGAARGAVVDLRLSRGPGVVAVVGAPEDGTLALVDVLSGQRRPERGKVLVEGRRPHEDAALRSRIGVLGHTPDLAPGRSVLASVERALGARGEAVKTARDVLGEAGLSALGARDPRSLSFAEARAVEAALSLSLARPALVVLSEPLAEVASIPSSFVLERARAASERCTVVVITSSPADARRLTSGSAGDVVLALHRGAFARAGDAEGRLVFPRSAELSVWVSSRLRELTRRLGDDAAVHGLSWETTARTELGEAGVVRVAGADPSALALSVADAATATGATIAGISELEPTLAEVRTATEWLRHAARVADSARRAPGPGAVELPPQLPPPAHAMPAEPTDPGEGS